MNEKILFVDDQELLLDAVKRQFRKRFCVDTATGGLEAIKAVEERGPYAVVVCDLRMPDMTGIEVLARIREIAPNTVRVMLTGYADLASAVEAINKGSIFRFLTKPCSPELMTAVLEASIEQHRVVTAESVLLDRTLNGCVHVLTEILGLVNPNAFGRSMRLRRYIRRAIQHLSLRDPWQYEMAAMLSHIGCVSVPPDVLMKLQANHILRREEREMYDAHPVVGGRLLAEIPYLEPVAQMVARQNDPSIAPSDIRRDGDRVAVGAALLRLAKEFDELASRKVGLGEVLVVLQGLGYDPELVQALAEAAAEDEAMVIVPTRVRDLSVGAIVDEDVFATNGMLLVSNGQEVTPTVLERLHNFALGIGVVEPFRARVPRRAA